MTPDLAAELGTQETSALEFKRQWSGDRNAIRETICALANDLGGHGGGDLLIGVRNDGTAVDELDTSDETLLNLTQLASEGRILPRPTLVVGHAEFTGKPVIRIRVSASHTPPLRFDGAAWVRPGPLTRRASPDEERILSERRKTLDQPFDSQPVPGGGVADLDIALFNQSYLPAAVDAETLEENHRPSELQLASLRMTDSIGSATVLGLLLVGLDPTDFLPGAYLQFVRIDGIDFDGGIVDEQEMRGNIIGTASQLEAVLKGHLHSRLVEVDGFREETHPTYPFEALREVCMNALMHRNYESSNAPVRILWFNDRIEVANPGGPYGQVRIDNFDHVNDYRNPALAAAMKDLGYVNRFGRGIGRIRTALARNGNPAPEFLIDEASWTVTMRSMN